jgi:hypothetical protein
MRLAGYHNDMVALSILHAGSNVTKKAAKQAFLDGRKVREAGVRCTCKTCKPVKEIISNTGK